MTPRPSQSLKKYISIRDFTIFHIFNGEKKHITNAKIQQDGNFP